MRIGWRDAQAWRLLPGSPSNQRTDKGDEMIQSATQTRRGGMESPVDNATYDLLQALTSKLESIEAYEMYRDDAQGDGRELFEELLRDDRKHAERLLDALRDKLR